MTDLKVLPALKAWKQAQANTTGDQYWQSQHGSHSCSQLGHFFFNNNVSPLKIQSCSEVLGVILVLGPICFLIPAQLAVPVLSIAWILTLPCTLTKEALILSYITMQAICAQCLAIFVVTHFIIIAITYRWNNSLNTSLFRGTDSDRVKWNMSSLWPDKRIAY